MNKLLVVVDMQNDFINGSLGTADAVNIVSNVANKIKNWDGDIICTRDTHTEEYLDTREGKHLPVKHCVLGTDGHQIHRNVIDAIMRRRNANDMILDKYTFGSTVLPELIKPFNYNYVELVGLCTGICVVSNALLLKAIYPEIDIAVDASCCACVTPESHNAALLTMKMCQIEIINE